MKYTAQILIKDLRNNHQQVLDIFKVKASDRTYQLWERKPLSVSLWSQSVFKQKVDYIHANPVEQVSASCLKNINIHLHLFILNQI